MQLLYNNAIFYLIIIIFLFIIKAHTLAKMSIIIWLFSGICTIIYTLNLLGGWTEFNLMPILFFDICLLIYIYPLIKVNVSNINITSQTIDNIERLMLILGLIAFLPFVEHSIYMVNTYSVASNNIVDMYEDKMDGKANIITWLDPLAYFFYGIIGNFQYIMVFLLFILFCKKKSIKKWKLMLYGIAVLTPILGSINTSGRGSLFFFLISLCILYSLFKNVIIIRIPKTMKIFFLGIIVAFISSVILITILRNEGADYDAWIWSSLYFGEGQINFFQDMWKIRTFTEGDNCFSYFKHILGFDTFINYLDRREFWNITKTGVDPVRFYTFIGDWFSDIGYFTIILVALLSMWIASIRRKNKWNILNLYAIYMYCYVICTGFTYFSLKTYYNTYHVVLGAIIIFLSTKIKFSLKNTTI